MRARRSRARRSVAAHARRVARAARPSNAGSARCRFAGVVERLGRTASSVGASRSTSASARKKSVMSTSAACSSACSACISSTSSSRHSRQAQLGGDVAAIARGERLDVTLQARPAAARSSANSGASAFGEPRQVPVRDLRLLAEAVAAAAARRWCSASSPDRSRRSSRTGRSRWSGRGSTCCRCSSRRARSRPASSAPPSRAVRSHTCANHSARTLARRPIAGAATAPGNRGGW